MKKLLYTYIFSLIALLIASSFLASNEKMFVAFVYSLILIIIIINNFIVKRSTKELVIEVVVLLVFVLYVVFAENKVCYSNIIIGLLPLLLSTFQTLKSFK